MSVQVESETSEVLAGNAAEHERFRRILYEAVIFGLGHTLSLYDKGSARMLVRELGRQIREYLTSRGEYRIKPGNTADEALQAIVEFFVAHGFTKVNVISTEGSVLHAQFSQQLGFFAYERIRASGGDTFISCPMSAMINDALSHFGKEMIGLNEIFDTSTEIIESWEAVRDRSTPDESSLSMNPERILEAERETSRQLRMREEFIRVASHELSTPITSAELALSRLDGGSFNEKDRKSLDLVKRQVQRLKRLSRQMLDTTVAQRGGMHLARTRVALAPLVRDVAELLDGELSRSGSPLTLSSSESVVALVDPGRVEQLVTNVLTNAIKYGEGKPIRMGVQARDGKAVITVADHGIGIAPAELAMIFEPFARSASVDLYAGLGLGLYIARQIAELHGGTLVAESTLGVGSTFTATLLLGDSS